MDNIIVTTGLSSTGRYTSLNSSGNLTLGHVDATELVTPANTYLYHTTVDFLASAGTSLDVFVYPYDGTVVVNGVGVTAKPSAVDLLDENGNVINSASGMFVRALRVTQDSYSYAAILALPNSTGWVNLSAPLIISPNNPDTGEHITDADASYGYVFSEVHTAAGEAISLSSPTLPEDTTFTLELVLQTRPQ
jgi:hypothetical protein